MSLHPSHPLRIFAVSGALTVILGSVIGVVSGLSGLWLFAVLTVLEVTFSFDNAVVNSRVLLRLSPLWQKLFLTIGIFIAVFVVRFALPLLIVMTATGLDVSSVLTMALHEPKRYSEALHTAGPVIDAFGGTFLLMISLSYFFDHDKVVHWLRPVERGLAGLGKIRFIKLIVMLVVAALIFLTVGEDLRQVVLVSSLLGVILQVGLETVGDYFEKSMTQKSGVSPVQLVGWAALASFLYLEILDASFSFDGVIGAFAITNGVLLIVAGLGVGALWVRSLTVYLMRTRALAKYHYLEHGAHWAIMALGVVMLVKLYRVEFAEWLTGSLGLIFVATAVVTSVVEKHRQIITK